MGKLRVKISKSHSLINMLTSLSLFLLIGCQHQNVPVDPSGTALPESKADHTWWTPEPGQSWQLQYDGEIDLSLDVDIYNLDLFETTSDDIQELHDRGVRVICYLNAGAWENWRPDSQDFPQEILGNVYLGWPGERWLDIRQMDRLAPLMIARLDLCVEKGCDGVDPDNLDGYLQPTGFDLTSADQLNYNRWLAREAHRRGLGIGLKNDPEQAGELADDFDWITTESCLHQDWCDLVEPFIQAGKPVFAVEYAHETADLSSVCATELGQQIQPILKHRSLDAWLATCP